MACTLQSFEAAATRSGTTCPNKPIPMHRPHLEQTHHTELSKNDDAPCPHTNKMTHTHASALSQHHATCPATMHLFSSR